MTSKITSVAALCLFLAALASNTTNAQQRKFVGDFRKPFIYAPRPSCNPITNGIHPQYRTYDGTNNNISSTSKKEWGAADIQLYRELAAVYGTSDTKNAMAGETRPSPRLISNVLVDEPVTTFNSRGLSTFVYEWGQFIDHDMSLTPSDTIESVPVQLPPDETLFTQPIPFTRSTIRTGTGATNQRQQSNIITAWLDASMVYGSDATRAAWLRTFVHGKLKSSSGNLLPWNTVTGEQSGAIDPNAPSMANDADHTVKTFVAGDVRAAEQTGLTSMHTVFMREHNRICDQLVAQGYTNDEQIYQIARKRVGATIQAITYQEFLPALGVVLSNYCGYNSSVRPDITNIFATAGYRLGHTMVADELSLKDNACADVGPGDVDLLDAFFNPQLLVTYGVEPFLKGNATHLQYETDTKINSVLRNFLFGPGFGLDLASLNIQRGRDHGLPDYNTVRKYYTGARVTLFSQITSDPVKAAAMKTLYGDVNNIDLWVGILAEDRLSGKSVGKTVNAILKSQFEKLRDGDYYYYKNDPYLTSTVRNQLLTTKLKDVIQRNTTLTSLQSNLFYVSPCPGEDGTDRIAYAQTSSVADMKVFPNPVTDLVTIETGTEDVPCSISIYNMSGMLVKMFTEKLVGGSVQVSMAGMAPGAYFMNLNAGGKVQSCRLIKLED